MRSTSSLLYEEVCVAWSSKDHPLEAVTELTLDDLAGEVLLTSPTPDAIQQAAFADAVLLVPMSIARTFSRRDMVYRPVTDAPTTRIGLAWRADDEQSLDRRVHRGRPRQDREQFPDRLRAGSPVRECGGQRTNAGRGRRPAATIADRGGVPVQAAVGAAEPVAGDRQARAGGSRHRPRRRRGGR
jgi:hypothetical protein